MVILIAGASHTGKTALAQRLLERYHWPYLSIDHLKMGLIRAGLLDLTPMDDDRLAPRLWPIVREMVKTAVENEQNLIVEGCYIPFDWQKDFSAPYLEHIRYRCLVLSECYIRQHFQDILAYASVIERRLDDSDFTLEQAIRDNGENLRLCQQYNLPYFLIDEEYLAEFDSFYTKNG